MPTCMGAHDGSDQLTLRVLLLFVQITAGSPVSTLHCVYDCCLFSNLHCVYDCCLFSNLHCVYDCCLFSTLHY